MSQNTIKKPDYLFWSRMNMWKLKDAALLLHGLEPLENKTVKFTASMDKVPEHLMEAYKTYLIFQTIEWDCFIRQSSAHPFNVLSEVYLKGLFIPPELCHLLIERITHEMQFNKEEKKYQFLLDKMKVTPPLTETSAADLCESPLTTRERRNFLRIIGILVRLYFEEKNVGYYTRGTKLNAYRMAEKLLEKANDLGIKTEDLKSLDRKITEALELLVAENNVT